MNNKQALIEIADLAFDGKSVGHMDGKVVFLDHGIPGETVLANIVQQKARYNVGQVTEIVTKSADRVEARCDHVAICGGCSWQDLDYNRQLHYKHKQVGDCLQRLGGLDASIVSPIIGADPIFRYRNKMEFSFHVDESTSLGFTLGLHHRGRYDQIFDVAHCHLTSERANQVIGWIRDFVIEHKIPVYDVSNHAGFLRFLVIREGTHTNQILVNIVTNYGDMPEQTKLVDSLTAEFPEVVTIVHNQNGQKSNIAAGEIEIILHGPGYLEEKLFDKIFRIRANSFFQTNSYQTEKLYETGFEMLDMQPTDNLLDLYCGAGAIGILAADRVNSVLGVELVPAAIVAARENAAINNVSNIDFFEGDVKDFLKSQLGLPNKYNAVILDPPRAGLHPKALRRTLELQPEKILYISCNPATFSRDAKEIVSQGYTLPKVTPIDMFPHTKHIELAAVFFHQ
ncbi:MAG: 23S rRNA (uracil(1939)-C(5))-methyltransferase RlmD [candidate division Zixibacteria bacterium]|nr:23S rRNA (uracil(1939)-C(5))-methyltransferase RlmD [candidate division Zixibacteria bacterium]